MLLPFREYVSVICNLSWHVGEWVEIIFQSKSGNSCLTGTGNTISPRVLPSDSVIAKDVIVPSSIGSILLSGM